MLYILGVQAKPKKNTYVGSQTRRRTTRQDGIRASGTEDSQREDSHSTLNKGSRKAIKTLKHLNKGVKHLPCWCTSACTLAHSSRHRQRAGLHLLRQRAAVHRVHALLCRQHWPSRIRSHGLLLSGVARCHAVYERPVLTTTVPLLW